MTGSGQRPVLSCSCHARYAAYWSRGSDGLLQPTARNAVYQELIRAENLIDRMVQGDEDWISFDQKDLDADGNEVGALVGVVSSVLAMIRDGATHVGVATDHTVESFRNDLWADYKDGVFEGRPDIFLKVLNPATGKTTKSKVYEELSGELADDDSEEVMDLGDVEFPAGE